MSATGPIRAAFQGERGAFSEEAAARAIAAPVEALPFRTFDDIFAAVERDAADCAIVPVENTLMGSVIRSYDLLLERELTIVGEVVLRVVHNLIAPPGVALEAVRRVYTHPVALAQCERFLQAHPEMEAVAAYDTAGSVKMVMEAGRRDEAAIASAGAAAAHGGHILAAGIESNPQNFTRFLVVVRPDRPAPPVRGDAAARKTSIVFRIGHRPGALYGALAGFAEAAVDLTKIESRPIEGRPFEYSFYLDFIGDPSAPAVAAALARLGAQAESLRVLGAYPRAPL